MPFATNPLLRRGWRAVTLLEMIVALALLALLATVMARLFRDSLAWQQRTLRRANLQQQLQLALQRVSRDLQQSAIGGIGVDTNRLSIQRIFDVSSDIPPRPSWETALVLYFVNQDGLRRRTWPPNPPALSATLSSSHPFRPDPTQLEALCLPERATVVGKNIVTLALSNPSTLPLNLTVEVADEHDRLTATRLVTLRNSE